MAVYLVCHFSALGFEQGGCSVSSDDIEKCFQKQQNTMTFTINDDNYTLNFASMSATTKTFEKYKSTT